MPHSVPALTVPTGYPCGSGSKTRAHNSSLYRSATPVRVHVLRRCLDLDWRAYALGVVYPYDCSAFTGLLSPPLMRLRTRGSGGGMRGLFS